VQISLFCAHLINRTTTLLLLLSHRNTILKTNPCASVLIVLQETSLEETSLGNMRGVNNFFLELVSSWRNTKKQGKEEIMSWDRVEVLAIKLGEMEKI